MSTTAFYFFVLMMFGVISGVVGALLTGAHALNDSATGRRQRLLGFAIKGLSRSASRRMLITGCVLIVVGAIAILVAN